MFVRLEKYMAQAQNGKMPLLHVADCPKIRFEQKTNNNIDSSFFILPYKQEVSLVNSLFSM